MRGSHRNAHRVPSVRVDAVTLGELEQSILSAYSLAYDRARTIVGDDLAFDAVHDAIVGTLARRPFLPRVSPWYVVKASTTNALLRRRRERLVPVENVDDVAARDRSDVVQDSGSPLAWAVAWETIAEREQAERIRAERAAARTMPLHVPIAEILAAK